MSMPMKIHVTIISIFCAVVLVLHNYSSTCGELHDDTRGDI